MSINFHLKWLGRVLGNGSCGNEMPELSYHGGVRPSRHRGNSNPISTVHVPQELHLAPVELALLCLYTSFKVGQVDSNVISVGSNVAY